MTDLIERFNQIEHRAKLYINAGHDLWIARAAAMLDIDPAQVNPEQRDSVKHFYLSTQYSVGDAELLEEKIARTDSEKFIEKRASLERRLAHGWKWLKHRLNIEDAPERRVTARREGIETTVNGPGWVEKEPAENDWERGEN